MDHRTIRGYPAICIYASGFSDRGTKGEWTRGKDDDGDAGDRVVVLVVVMVKVVMLVMMGMKMVVASFG